MFVGVDGCKAGWVSVALTDGGLHGAGAFTTFGALLDAHRTAKVIAVDMPIGLVDAGREVDQVLRAFLKGQASSVFTTPPRAALAAKSNDDAQRRSRELTGRGVSKQSLALAPKIFEVDAHAADPRIHEVHPEVSFRMMNDGNPLPHRKKSWGGMQARLRLLHRHGIALPPSLGAADPVGIDDVIDAAAAAWSARRIHEGSARRFPEHPRQKDAGRTIVVWA